MPQDVTRNNAREYILTWTANSMVQGMQAKNNKNNKAALSPKLDRIDIAPMISVAVMGIIDAIFWISRVSSEKNVNNLAYK